MERFTSVRDPVSKSKVDLVPEKQRKNLTSSLHVHVHTDIHRETETDRLMVGRVHQPYLWIRPSWLNRLPKKVLISNTTTPWSTKSSSALQPSSPMPPSTLSSHLWTQPRVASFLPGKVIQLSHHMLPVWVSPYDAEPVGGHAIEMSLNPWRWICIRIHWVQVLQHHLMFNFSVSNSCS